MLYWAHIHIHECLWISKGMYMTVQKCCIHNRLKQETTQKSIKIRKDEYCAIGTQQNTTHSKTERLTESRNIMKNLTNVMMSRRS